MRQKLSVKVCLIKLINLLSYLPKHIQGIILALVSTAMFVFVGVMVRVLSEQIDLFQILLFRQFVFLTLLSPAIIKSIDVLMKPRMIPCIF